MQGKEMLWNVRRTADGQEYGPYTRQELADLVQERRLALEDVARSETGEVMRVGEVLEGRPSSIPRAVETSAPSSGRSEPQGAEYAGRGDVSHREGHAAQRLPHSGAPQYGAQPAVEWGGWSIAAVVCAAVGLLICPIIFGVLGIVFAVIGKNNGEGQAQTALIIAIVLTALSVVLGALVGAWYVSTIRQFMPHGM